MYKKSEVFLIVLDHAVEFADDEGVIFEGDIADELKRALEFSEITVSESKFSEMLSNLIIALEVKGYVVV